MRALMDLRYAARAIATHELGSLELLESALRVYRTTEPSIRAFAWLDEERALRQARERDNEASRGPLHGVPVGVKDIFDTAGIPTEYGSALFAGRIPRVSSAVVGALESAGAIVIGKTVTAELAYYSPGPTRNPYDTARTPGGSSQGSAAAVSAGVVPAAVGSQTNGSIIRPAAYCGIVGFKPTAGRVSTAGALQFSHTLDQVGGLTRTVEDAALLAATLAGGGVAEWFPAASSDAPRLAAVRTDEWRHADRAMRNQFDADVEAVVATGGIVEWPELPTGLDQGPELVSVLMAYESARSIGPTAFARPDLVSAEAYALFERGIAISTREYSAALSERQRLIAVFRDWAAKYDVILTPPATGEAPEASTTGSPRFCSRWSLLGAPALSIPTGRGTHGMPLGLQLVGGLGEDRRLLSAARWIESALRDIREAPDT